MAKQILSVPVNTAWFDSDPDNYLSRQDFIRFQEVSGVDFRDLLSDDINKVNNAQKKLAEQSIILNEIQKSHFGYSFPFLVYTHCLDFFPKIQNHNQEIDKTILAFDMCDSLRRRHLALSHAVIPNAIDAVYSKKRKPVILKNLGSGVGLDLLNALVNMNGKVAIALNYDTCPAAIEIGSIITRHWENQGKLKWNSNRYLQKSLTESNEAADVIIKVGVICGLNDSVARFLLMQNFKLLNEGGKLIVSSSNWRMEADDPLASFLIQRIGSSDDPSNGWALNFRNKEKLYQILTEIGFSSIEIYDDSNFPGADDIKDLMYSSVDTSPAEIFGHSTNGAPLCLPTRETLEKKNGYNWIAVATK